MDEYIATKYSVSDGIYARIPMFIFLLVLGARLQDIY
jgi:hypothetical protein